MAAPDHTHPLAKAVTAHENSSYLAGKPTTHYPQRLSGPVGSPGELGYLAGGHADPSQLERTNERPPEGSPVRSVASELRRLVRVGALLCEVLLRSVRSVRVDNPRSVLRFVRASEVLAKETAQRLGIATDFERKCLRSVRLCVCHFLTSLRVHMDSVHDVRSFVKRSSEESLHAFVRASTNAFVRQGLYKHFTNHPPCRPPEGPIDVGVAAPRAKRAGCMISSSLLATYEERLILA